MGSRVQEEQPSQEQIDAMNKFIWSQLLRYPPESLKLREIVHEDILGEVINLCRKCAAEEREACAKVAEHFVDGQAVGLLPGQQAIWHRIADAIRARGI